MRPSRRQRGWRSGVLMAVLACAVPVAAAWAAPLSTGLGVVRAWSGAYGCAQGMTGLRLMLSTAPGGKLEGLFDFYPVPQNPGVPRGCFEIHGQIDAAGRMTLLPGRWRVQPPYYVGVALVGQELASGALAGRVLGPGCTSFALQPVAPAQIGALQSACIGAVS